MEVSSDERREEEGCQGMIINVALASLFLSINVDLNSLMNLLLVLTVISLQELKGL